MDQRPARSQVDQERVDLAVVHVVGKACAASHGSLAHHRSGLARHVFKAPAADTAKQLDEAHDRAHTGKFLEHTTYVIEQLHSLAVDIARIFQPSVEEELWKRYYKGDQGVFLRHITKTLSRQKFEAIQRKYQTDEKFRAYVMRYLKEYSALVKHARATDRAEVLTTTFSTSDMGKLYMLLSKSMEAGAAEQATG